MMALPTLPAQSFGRKLAEREFRRKWRRRTSGRRGVEIVFVGEKGLGWAGPLWSWLLNTRIRALLARLVLEWCRKRAPKMNVVVLRNCAGSRALREAGIASLDSSRLALHVGHLAKAVESEEW